MAHINNWFKQTFVIKRLISEEDWSEDTYLTVGTFKGFIQPLSGDTQVSSGKQTFTLTHTIYCQPSVVFNTDDLIYYGGKEYIVRTYQMSGISGIEDHQEVGVEYVDGNQS